MGIELFQKILESVTSYVLIKQENNIIFSNIPERFDVKQKEPIYNGDYFLKNEYSFVHENQLYMVTSFNDVSKLKMKINNDQKTGILSDAGFKENIQKRILDKENFILGMFDIDNFKNINDTYGHDVGDEVLLAIANKFKHHLKSKDSIGRFGGDEFMLAMSDIDIDKAIARVEEVTSSIGNGIVCKSKIKLFVTISAGLKPYDYDLSFEENLKEVDKLLYESKRNGKDRISTQNEKHI